MKYPFLETLLLDARKVIVLWRIDQQQSDPVHQNWNWASAREELLKLLITQPNKDSADHQPKRCTVCESRNMPCLGTHAGRMIDG